MDQASMTGDHGKLDQEAAAAAEPVVHKVPLSVHSSVGSDARRVVRETFFHTSVAGRDGGWFPAGLSRPRQALAALQCVFPILDWLPSYTPRLFFRDLLAGLTTASLAVPQDLGYAALSGIPPIYGLYSSFVPPLVYAVFGTSRNISIGPVAVVSLLLGEFLKQELSPTDDAADYLRLAFTATFFAGIFQAGMGILRLGFITEYLSHAAIVGFMAGAAITIAMQQLRGLFNIVPTAFSKHADLVSVVKSVIRNYEVWNWRTIVMTLAFIAFLTSMKLLVRKKPKLFMAAAMAPLVSMILATAVVFVTRIDKRGVQIAGYVKKGVNPSSAHQIFFSGPFVRAGAKIGLIAGLVALTEGLAIGRTFAALREHRVDGNKEMMAFGAMNVCGSLCSCYVTTGSFSRSALSYAAGGRTAMANVVMSVLVATVLSALTPLIYYTPVCILSAIVTTAVLAIIDVSAVRVLWRVDKMDFLTCAAAFFGTLFVSVEIGLLMAVSISFAKILFNVTRPHVAILGNVPSSRAYRDVAHYSEATRVPGFLVICINNAIYFSNAAYVRDKIMVFLADEKQRVEQAKGPQVHYLILDLTRATNIDMNGIIVLEEIEKIFRKQGIQLALANPGPSVIEKLDKSNFLSKLGTEWIFMTVGEAVQVCSIFMHQQGV